MTVVILFNITLLIYRHEFFLLWLKTSYHEMLP
jgi:hypothetical protein